MSEPVVRRKDSAELLETINESEVEQTVLGVIVDSNEEEERNQKSVEGRYVDKIK